MPYLNEHAARLREPRDFVANSFRRKNNELGQGIHAIYARLRGEEKMTLQAIRFAADRFSPEAAQKWLEEHGYEVIVFEPAVKAKMSEVPREALCFAADMRLGDNGPDARSQPVELMIRSAAPIEHPYWGTIAHDMDGVVLHKPKVAIDYNHSDELIGYLSHFERTAEGLRATGALCPSGHDGDHAVEIIHRMAQGVPYEASIFFADPLIEEVYEGETAAVNGYTLSGPAKVVRSWTLRGVAVCPYGADAHTHAVIGKMGASGDVAQVAIMERAMEQEKKEEKQETEEIQEEKQEEKQETEGQKFMRVFGRERGAVWYAEGLSFEIARDRYLTELAIENETLRKTIDELRAASEKRAHAIEPLGTSVASERVDFLAASRARAREKRIPLTAAMREVAHEYPEVYREFREKRKE